jgi:hypothetical protein
VAHKNTREPLTPPRLLPSTNQIASSAIPH